MNSAVIQLVNATKKFKDHVVLDGLDFEIPQGSVVGLLGKNGSGKTTLLKLLLGLLKLDAGTSKVYGEDSWDLSANAKARIGYVPQEIQLYDWMKVRQLLKYTAAFYPAWDSQLVQKLTDEWEVDLEKKAGLLSVGQKQKLAIILALGYQPDLLILDEPVASLDPVARREFLRTILDIAQDESRTILFSTHITSDLERVADRIAVMKEGQIATYGNLDDLKDQIKRLRIVSSSDLPESFVVPGELRSEISGRQALVSVNNSDPQLVEQLQSTWDAQVTVEDLSLEEIFLEMHHVK
ncbi:MAG: ABC transporter ATP-binding protein [Planctomycetaceae bacterium]|nr:ABC transporter ATP-binding protein [Planctomycetaceae bacterium]